MHRRALAIIAILASLAVSLVVAASPAAAASTWYVSTTGSGTACTSSSPCGSFEAALGKAKPGDTVRVKAGSYGLQEIDRSVSWNAASANITFRPHSGSGTVTVGGIRSHVPSLTFTGFIDTGVMYFHPGADDNHAVGNTIDQAYVTGADDTLWQDNLIDPATNGPDAMQVKGLDGDNPVGVTIIGNVLGPQLLEGDSHTDCLQILGGDDIYVARNIFFPCADKSIQIRSGAGGTVGSVLIESNFISECAPRTTLCNGYHAVTVSAEGNDIRFVHNSINGSVGLSSGSVSGGEDDLHFYGNIAAEIPCTPHTDWNLIDGKTCGSNDINGRPNWVDPASTVQDLHLATGSKGIGVGSPHVPSIDIDGQAGCSGDLGADQTCGSSSSGVSKEMSEAIAWLHEVGITTEGPGAGAFGHLDTNTRAHTVTFLWRAYGRPAEPRAARPSDVIANQWYTPPVRWTIATGAVTGYPDGTFRPHDAISRGDFALILWRAAGSPSAPNVSLTDVSTNAYYYEAIRWANDVGVMNGFADGTFRPDDPIIRGHVALMLCRFSDEVSLPVGRCA
ncbi:MAG: S-layer homology domain-containing protein [Acidimicrobiales bacterium]|nr:S-layer homology domain-containing protein [Acidimicrobiales bacterium]